MDVPGSRFNIKQCHLCFKCHMWAAVFSISGFHALSLNWLSRNLNAACFHILRMRKHLSAQHKPLPQHTHQLSKAFRVEKQEFDSFSQICGEGIVHYTMWVAEGPTLHIDRNAFYFGIKHNDEGMKTSERRSQRVAYTDENNNMWTHIYSAATQAALFKTLESCYRRVHLKYWIYANLFYFIFLIY